MITLANFCLLAAVTLAPNGSSEVPTFAPSTVAPVAIAPASVAAVAAPQGPNRPTPGRRSPPPGGGTPEPTTMLLLAGGALSYGVLRLRKRKSLAKDS